MHQTLLLWTFPKHHFLSKDGFTQNTKLPKPFPVNMDYLIHNQVSHIHQQNDLPTSLPKIRSTNQRKIFPFLEILPIYIRKRQADTR